MGNMGMCDAMFVCLLNELSWEEKKLFCQARACPKNISVPGFSLVELVVKVF